MWFRYEKDSPDVLRNLSFQVPKESIFAIVGGNGTGIAGNMFKDETVSIVLNDISKYGIEVDGNGATLKATSSLNIGETPIKKQ